MSKKALLPGIVLLSMAVFGVSCSNQRTTTPPSVTTNYTVTQLKYLLIDEFGEPFFVDTDFYPIGREGIEEQHAIEQFPAIRADAEQFVVILQHLGMSDQVEYTTNETVSIYREYKKMSKGVQLTGSGDRYTFSIRVGVGQGELIEGTVTMHGKVTVTKREPSFNTYPICLAEGTLIDTPNGQIPVEKIQIGMKVWTVDGSGQRVAAAVIRTVSTPVPLDFQLVKLTLSDGRAVTASPGHPTADNRAIGGYLVGDLLDGARVVSAYRFAYGYGATYDILPSGGTGKYWADGVLLTSTLPGYPFKARP